MPEFLQRRAALIRDYAAAISGSAGRLVFSLIYFVALANTLSIEDFGVFATASAAGTMLSRIVAFGFISSLYRVAAVRPVLLGTFTAGFLVMALASLPVLAVAAWATHRIFFDGAITLPVFAAVIVAECLLWRLVEVVVIVNNGLGRFGRAAVLVITGTLLRAAAAGLFMVVATPSLSEWAAWYVGANALALIIAMGFYWPRPRLRLRMRLYWKRLPDALYVAGAEILFYLQMELDKLLVLALGGPKLAGIYAIVMRLVDLTAIPIRTFTMMLVQRMMRTPEMLQSLKARAGIEGAVFMVSTFGLLALALVLDIFPNILGRNVAQAVPLVALALCIPGLRNLVEYQAELLFARGQTGIRAVNLAALAALKVGILWWLLTQTLSSTQLVAALNLVFAALYVVSAVITYVAMRRPAKRF